MHTLVISSVSHIVVICWHLLIKLTFQSMCNLHLSAYVIPPTASTVTSPGYPRNYPNSYSRTWTLRVEASQTVVLKIDDFYTESDYDLFCVSIF